MAALSRELSEALVKAFLEGGFDEIKIISNRFVSIMAQDPELTPLLPAGTPETAVEETEGDTDEILEQVLQYQVDGVVTAAILTPKQLSLFEKAGIPVIFYNRTLGELPVNSVRCDQEEGERWLVSELGFVDFVGGRHISPLFNASCVSDRP